MARGSRPRSSAQSPAASGDRAASPFEVLASLRGQRRTGVAGIKPKAPKPSKPGAPTPTAPPEQRDSAAAETGVLAPEDLALFRAAVGDATPLAPDGRAVVDTPKPAPVPRPRMPEPETPAAAAPDRRLPADDDALFRAEIQDVTPLKDHGRLDIGPAPHRVRPGTVRGPAATFGMQPPPTAEPTDPAALFRHAVRGALPIDNRNRVELARPPPPPAPLKRVEDEDAALRESLEAPLSFEDRLDMGDEAAFLRPGLPRRVLTDLRRGRWVLQGEIDLHGLTREEAREALARFLAASLQHGRRCVRVIHGKGLGSPGRFGILKHLSRGWLAQREEILAFCQAGPHAGGSGALLVLLRAGTAGQHLAGGPDGRP